MMLKLPLTALPMPQIKRSANYERNKKKDIDAVYYFAICGYACYEVGNHDISPEVVMMLQIYIMVIPLIALLLFIVSVNISRN